MEFGEWGQRVRGDLGWPGPYTQEALGHSRGRYLLPRIQSREVELLLRDTGRASRFCGSPRGSIEALRTAGPLFPRHLAAGSPAQKQSSLRGFGPNAAPSQASRSTLTPPRPESSV